jgi:hypothetical protein
MMIMMIIMIIMMMQAARLVHNDEHLCCGQHKFENVKEIPYLGSQMNQTNSISSEIQARILSANRCYYADGEFMESRALNRRSKLKIHKSSIRPAVTYGCEAWTLTDRDEQHLGIFERRILRKIFGPVQNENGCRGISYMKYVNGRRTGLVTFCVETAFYNGLLKER